MGGRVNGRGRIGSGMGTQIRVRVVVRVRVRVRVISRDHTLPKSRKYLPGRSITWRFVLPTVPTIGV